VRDFVYVDDAVDAFLRAGATDDINGAAFNVAGREHLSHHELVELLIEVAGTGRYRFVDWPAEKKVIDIGSFYADSAAFSRAVGWEPQVCLREGLGRTLAYYRQHRAHYLDPVEPAGGMA